MRILKSKIPIDDQWHEMVIGTVVQVAHQEFGFVTVWWIDNGVLYHPIFRVFGTGHDIDPHPSKSVDPVYVGTAFDRGHGLVWHLVRA